MNGAAKHASKVGMMHAILCKRSRVMHAFILLNKEEDLTTKTARQYHHCSESEPRPATTVPSDYARRTGKQQGQAELKGKKQKALDHIMTNAREAKIATSHYD